MQSGLKYENRKYKNSKTIKPFITLPKKSPWASSLFLCFTIFLIGRLLRQVPTALEAFQFSYLHPSLVLSGLEALAQWLEAIIVLQREKHPSETIKVKPCISLSLRCSMLSPVCHIRSQQGYSERNEKCSFEVCVQYSQRKFCFLLLKYIWLYCNSVLEIFQSITLLYTHNTILCLN